MSVALAGTSLQPRNARFLLSMPTAAPLRPFAYVLLGSYARKRGRTRAVRIGMLARVALRCLMD